MVLLLVESPTKAKTLKNFLGKGYQVKASMGHIRDLPKGELGVDVEHNFQPRYVIPTKARKTVNELKKEVKSADKVILASDEDREGESIAWHLSEALGLKNPERIVFHEITEDAIKDALENPRKIDMNLVNAQQARRILDRLVGYELSPFLWKKVVKGLSAGRVQSVAVRLVADREGEIENFKPIEYWSIIAHFATFDAFLIKKDGEKIDKLTIKNEKQAADILKNLEAAEYKIEKIEKKETKRNPLPPFTTSSLQQASWQRFHYSAKMTMSLAQKLYETGYITYHRTDSLNLSQMSLAAAKKFIEETFGKNYWPGYSKQYKARKNAQEAHEAIRPTFADKTPESTKASLDSRQFKLYQLIWQRFIASQMAEARFDSQAIEIKANEYAFSANGQTLKFDGFLKVYPMKFTETNLPALKLGEVLELIELTKEQHFTEPPARYNEASLIKTLEKYGIGRPSTYAPIMSTIQERNYIAKNEQKKFVPTEMGIIVNDILAEHFPQIIDIDFTAKMEKELDEVAEGKDTWQKTCADFYEPFSKNLKQKYKDVQKQDLTEKTDKKCIECGSAMILRLGKFGKFYACSAFPKCRYTESLESPALGIKCPKCGVGAITAKKTKRGKIFYGCNKYPECDFALWDKPIKGEDGDPEKCPKCGSTLVETKKGVKCSHKSCDYKRQ